MDNLIQGIKVNSEKPSAACLKVIRARTDLSFSVIKETIQNGGLFLETEMSDIDALGNIIDLYEQLSDLGINCELFELGYKSSIDDFQNRLKRNQEISRESWEELFSSDNE